MFSWKVQIFRYLLLSIIVGVISAAGGATRNWSYYYDKTGFPGPRNWDNVTGATCDGVRQSPIAITKVQTQYWKTLSEIKFLNADKDNSSLTLLNTGSSVAMKFPEDLTITFGGLGNLVPDQLHWHWGSVNTNGSEHSIDGKFYPIEGHFVCFNKDFYPNFETAAARASGLYVIGFLYEIGAANAGLESVIKHFPNIIEPGTNVTMSGPKVTTLLPTNLKNYYRYEGSLTTPPCTQNVIWSLLDTKLTISEAQLKAFRSLKYDAPDSPKNMEDNVRNLQSIAERSDYIPRIVYTSFPASSSRISLHICLQFIWLMFGLYLIN